MTRREIRDDILRRVWVGDGANAPAHVLADVTTAVNAALQTLYLIPDGDFFALDDYEVTVASGTDSVALDSAMQRLDSVRLANGRPLRPAASRQDILAYRRRFAAATYEEHGPPLAYWLEQRRASGPDAAAATLYVAPTPTAATQLKLEGKAEAPVYTVSAMAGNDPIAIAHRYVQSILLPLARYEATRSPWFQDEALRASLQSAAASAFTAVGLAVPWAADHQKAAS